MAAIKGSRSIHLRRCGCINNYESMDTQMRRINVSRIIERDAKGGIQVDTDGYLADALHEAINLELEQQSIESEVEERQMEEGRVWTKQMKTQGEEVVLEPDTEVKAIDALDIERAQDVTDYVEVEEEDLSDDRDEDEPEAEA
jgi:hypothetical protein